MGSTEDTAQVREVINEWLAAYSQRDVDKAMSMVVKDDNAVFFGSGADERRQGWDQLKEGLERDLSQCESIAITTSRVTITTEGPVAWASGDCNLDIGCGGAHMPLEGRFTLVLRKHGPQWLIEHLHLSVPAAAQAEGQSFPEK